MKRYNHDGCTIALTVVFNIVLACAVCGIAMTECQRSKMRYDIDKIKYEKFMDSIAQQKQITVYIFNKNFYQRG